MSHSVPQNHHMNQKEEHDMQGHWADLPPELLHHILAAAHEQQCMPPCRTALPSGGGVPLHGQPPSLSRVAALCMAAEACCRSWQAAALSHPPLLRVALGRSPLPLRGAGEVLRGWLERRRVAALHFEASQLPGCRSGPVQRLAIDLLGSDELQLSSAACLEELAVWDFCSSRPLCALLPRFPALRSLALTGYAIDLDLDPLSHLPRLTALHVEAEALPKLAALPATLRHLSLSCFANAARVSLPRGLQLDSLVCHCPGQPVFLGLGRALRQCVRIRITGCRIHLLLHLPAGRLQAAAAQPAQVAAAQALVWEFQSSSTVQQLELQAPQQQLALKLASQVEHSSGAAGPAGLMPAGRPAGSLEPQAVCECAAATDGVLASASLSGISGGGGGMAGGGLPHQGQALLVLLLEKPPVPPPAAGAAPEPSSAAFVGVAPPSA